MAVVDSPGCVFRGVCDQDDLAHGQGHVEHPPMSTGPDPRFDLCKHPKYEDGHCAEMTCWNYFSKCPKHSYSGNKKEKCSHETSTRK